MRLFHRLFLTILTPLLIAQTENPTSWKDEEEMIQSHIERLSEQQSALAQEMHALNEKMQQHQNCVKELQGSLGVLNAHQQQQREIFGRQIQQAMKWDLKQQNTQTLEAGQRGQAAKTYLLTKLLNEQKQQIKGQMQLIKDFDSQIQEHISARSALRAQLDEREMFFEQLMQNDQQLKQFLNVCRQEQVKEADIIAYERAITPKKTKAQLAAEPFNPASLTVPLPCLSGRHQKDFFGATVISGRDGEVISAVGPGKVIFSDQMKGLGLVVMIEHEGGFLSLYGNCSQIFKKLGESVVSGEDLATVGHSGQLGVSALYFEIRQDAQLIPPKWAPEMG